MQTNDVIQAAIRAAIAELKRDAKKDAPASTVPQFCDQHHISKVHFYNLVKQGKGPRLMKLGRRTLISSEAAADWRARMEAETSASVEV